MRKIVGPLMINNTALIVTGQRRYKIGGWGNPETMSGGQAIQHAASLRIDLSPRKPTKDKDGKPVRQPTHCYVKWSKIAPPSHSATIVIEYGRGICIEEEVLDLGEELGVFEKNGAYYYFTESESPDAHGSFGATVFLRDHQDILSELLDEIRKKLNGTEDETSSREIEEE
jgi:recombination protein RecA